MNRPLLALAAAFALISPFVVVADEAKPVEKKDVPATLNFTMKSLEGEDVNLAKYQGKVVLIVNTASECGLTGQYKPLQRLHEPLVTWSVGRHF